MDKQPEGKMPIRIIEGTSVGILPRASPHVELFHDNNKRLQVLMQEMISLLGLDCRLKRIRHADIQVCPGQEKNSSKELIIRIPLDVMNLPHLKRETGEGGQTQANREINGETDKQEKVDPDFIEELYEVMEKNYRDQDFNVEQLAKKLYLSKATLYRKIHALTGTNACDFIRSYRLNRAVLLLENNSGSVFDIAIEVGFNSRIYFTKCFKDKFHQTPSQFLERELREPE